MKVITDVSDVDKFLPARWADSFSSRKEAIKQYLKGGGVIKIGEMRGEWPRLLYPTREKLESEIKSVEKELESVDRQLSQARKRLSLLKNTPDKKIKVVLDPLFWRHKVKLLTDKEYKADYELIRPPVHLIHRPDWRKKIELFLNSGEYRTRLREARLSKIGKNRDLLENEVEARIEFSKSVVKSLLDKLERKKEELEGKLRVLKTLLNWARSSQS